MEGSYHYVARLAELGAPSIKSMPASFVTSGAQAFDAELTSALGQITILPLLVSEVRCEPLVVEPSAESGLCHLMSQTSQSQCGNQAGKA